MLGCFNPTLGQIWTNPAVGLNFYITFLTPQNWVKTTQHFLECKKKRKKQQYKGINVFK